MRRMFLGAFLALAFVGAAAAQEVWVLQSGPESCEGVPLDPVQPVQAWRGQYSDGVDQLWIYVTKSPFFLPPARPEIRKLGDTGWTAAVFYPGSWKADRRAAWLDRWAADFQVLSSLPDKGWPVLFPSVLRKG